MGLNQRLFFFFLSLLPLVFMNAGHIEYKTHESILNVSNMCLALQNTVLYGTLRMFFCSFRLGLFLYLIFPFFRRRCCWIFYSFNSGIRFNVCVCACLMEHVQSAMKENPAKTDRISLCIRFQNLSLTLIMFVINISY